MYITVHVLQSYGVAAPNCGRDGIPKMTTWGGHTRGRISSQSIKRSLRTSPVWNTSIPMREVAVRSRQHHETLVNFLVQNGIDGNVARTEAITYLTSLYSKSKPKKIKDSEELQDAKGLLFLSDGELFTIAQWLLAKITDPENTPKKPDLTDAMGVDVAMFGRMMANASHLDVVGALTVGHAVTTNAAHLVEDTYTAVDDLAPDTGAGFLGVKHLLSPSTFYRYYSLDVDQLARNLKLNISQPDDKKTLQSIVNSLLRGIVSSTPTGGVRGTDIYSLPDLVHVEVVRTGQPVSYAGAFATPTKTPDEAVIKFHNQVQEYQDTYHLNQNRDYITLANSLPQESTVKDFPALVAAVKAAL